MPDAIPDPLPNQPLPTDPGSLGVLEYLTRVAGVPFDPTRAAQAARAAAREIPPTQARAARLRLAQAAGALGVQLSARQLSVREALAFVAHDAPLAAFAVTPGGSARWFVLAEAKGDAGRLNCVGSA